MQYKVLASCHERAKILNLEHCAAPCLDEGENSVCNALLEGKRQDYYPIEVRATWGAGRFPYSVFHSTNLGQYPPYRHG